MLPIPRAFIQWDVLVVDDEKDNLEVAMRLLKIAGATAIAANNGKDALEKLAQIKPRFILCDLSMPEVDGWEFLYRTRQNAETAKIPVIAFTAHAMPGDRERVLNAGFLNYIAKPLDPPRFIHQLIAMLATVPELTPLLEAYA